MTGLRCPICDHPASEITDSRPSEHGQRRRRCCPSGHRYTTIEVVVAERPRTLVGMRLTTPALDKQKVIQRVVAELEATL